MWPEMSCNLHSRTIAHWLARSLHVFFHSFFSAQHHQGANAGRYCTRQARHAQASELLIVATQKLHPEEMDSQCVSYLGPGPSQPRSWFESRSPELACERQVRNRPSGIYEREGAGWISGKRRSGFIMPRYNGSIKRRGGNVPNSM